MKDMTKRLLALSPEKQAILLQRLKQKVGDRKEESGPPSSMSLSGDLSPSLYVPTTSRNEWVVRYRPNEQARLRLLCFPYAGGMARVYRPWLDALPSEVEL